jgi:hypothetical protein
MKYIVISRYENRTYIEGNPFLHMESAQEKMKEVLDEYVERFTGEDPEDVKGCWSMEDYKATANINGKKFNVYIIKMDIETKFLVVSFHNRDIYNMKEFDREQDAYFKMEEYLIEYFENDLELEYDEEEFKKTKRIDWNISTHYAWCSKDADLFEVEVVKL